MNRTKMHRGLAALALSLTLALSGAQPAAAASPGFWQTLSRLGSLWAAPTSSLWEKLGAWFSPTPQKNNTLPPPPGDFSDQGMGADPNGNSLVISGTSPIFTSGN